LSGLQPPNLCRSDGAGVNYDTGYVPESDSLMRCFVYQFKTLPTQELFPARQSIIEMNLAGRQLVLNIMGERQIRMHTDFVIGQYPPGRSTDCGYADLPIWPLPVICRFCSASGREHLQQTEILFKSITELIDRYQMSRLYIRPSGICTK
jgi:hypothetical protein